MNKKQTGKKSSPRKVLSSLLRIGISIYLILALVLFVFQKKLLFFPTTEIRVTPASNDWDFKSLFSPLTASRLSVGLYLLKRKPAELSSFPMATLAILGIASKQSESFTNSISTSPSTIMAVTGTAQVAYLKSDATPMHEPSGVT